MFQEYLEFVEKEKLKKQNENEQEGNDDDNKNNKEGNDDHNKNQNNNTNASKRKFNMEHFRWWITNIAKSTISMYLFIIYIYYVYIIYIQQFEDLLVNVQIVQYLKHIEWH